MNRARLQTTRVERLRWAARLVGALAVAATLSACALTQAARPKLAAAQCIFLPPNVCSMLTPGTKGEAALRYINPNVDWKKYTAAMVTPLAFYGDAKSELPAAESQALADYAHAAMVKAVGKEIRIVTVPGKNVMKIQAAITNVSAAVPILRTVSMVVPQARALATLKYIATGTYAFVGGAQGEAMVTDALTGQVLAAAVDRRVGGGSIATAAQWQWGDAQNVMDKWAQMSATRIADLRAGKLTD